MLSYCCACLLFFFCSFDCLLGWLFVRSLDQLGHHTGRWWVALDLDDSLWQSPTVGLWVPSILIGSPPMPYCTHTPYCTRLYWHPHCIILHLSQPHIVPLLYPNQAALHCNHTMLPPPQWQQGTNQHILNSPCDQHFVQTFCILHQHYAQHYAECNGPISISCALPLISILCRTQSQCHSPRLRSCAHVNILLQIVQREPTSNTNNLLKYPMKSKWIWDNNVWIIIF